MREVIFNDFTSGNHSSDLANLGVSGTTANADLMSSSAPKFAKSPTSNATNLNHNENPHYTQDSKNESLETHKGEQQAEVSLSDFGSFASESKGVTLKGNDRSLNEAISQKHQRDNADTPKQITLHSKYGNTKATFETTSASIMLPLTKGGEYFVFDDVRFFVIAGEGALYYLDCVKAYDFENLEAKCLEQFLLTGKQPRDYKQRGLIKDFLDIDTKNIQKGKMYLLPKDYEALQIHIMGGCL